MYCREIALAASGEVFVASRFTRNLDLLVEPQHLRHAVAVLQPRFHKQGGAIGRFLTS